MRAALFDTKGTLKLAPSIASQTFSSWMLADVRVAPPQNKPCFANDGFPKGAGDDGTDQDAASSSQSSHSHMALVLGTAANLALFLK
jgi:hypothetical protein